MELALSVNGRLARRSEFRLAFKAGIREEQLALSRASRAGICLSIFTSLRLPEQRSHLSSGWREFCSQMFPSLRKGLH